MSEEIQDKEPVVKVTGASIDGVQSASRLVYWLARLALKHANECTHHREKPEVGDIVIEYTHTIGLGHKQLGLIGAVGELIRVEKDDAWGTAFIIKTLEGKEQRWVNASMLVVLKKSQ